MIHRSKYAHKVVRLATTAAAAAAAAVSSFSPPPLPAKRRAGDNNTIHTVHSRRMTASMAWEHHHHPRAPYHQAGHAGDPVATAVSPTHTSLDATTAGVAGVYVRVLIWSLHSLPPSSLSCIAMMIPVSPGPITMVMTSRAGERLGGRLLVLVTSCISSGSQIWSV